MLPKVALSAHWQTELAHLCFRIPSSCTKRDGMRPCSLSSGSRCHRTAPSSLHHPMPNESERASEQERERSGGQGPTIQGPLPHDRVRELREQGLIPHLLHFRCDKRLSGAAGPLSYGLSELDDVLLINISPLGEHHLVFDCLHVFESALLHHFACLRVRQRHVQERCHLLHCAQKVLLGVGVVQQQDVRLVAKLPPLSDIRKMRLVQIAARHC
mmetsp:Transcript_14808/g.34737  ORF Transcript_14808/g.34737 Transcript_14808/m.34737 type:complete len:214 (-) Transcript_14808:845-1486(-)